VEDSKLWVLASSFSSSSLREAGRWINSPFYNRKEQVSRLWFYLYSYLKKALPAPTFESAFKAAYPDEVFDIGKLRLVMSDLFKLLLEFIAYQEWKKEDLSSLLYQSRYLNKVGLEKLAKQQLRLGMEAADKAQVRNADFYRYHYEILAEQYKLDYKSRPAETQQLQLLSESADQALISAKLRQACLAIAHRSVYTSTHRPGFIDQVLAYVKDGPLLERPAISLYYNCYYMLKEGSEDHHFYRFKQSLFEHSQAFPPSEVRDLSLMGINYCIQQVNQGAEHYFTEIMAFYKSGLQHGYLLENDQLSRFTYSNIVAAALRIEQYDWVENFIHQYRNKLDRYYRESSFSFCLAKLEYTRQRFDEALPLLQKANYKDPLLNLSAKAILLKIYYETEEYDLLHAHLDAMQNYIRRKRVIGYHKANYLNIIRFAKKLMVLNPYDKLAVQQFKKQVEEVDILTERRWLLKQLP
jgi:hypothetical protein